MPCRSIYYWAYIMSTHTMKYFFKLINVYLFWLKFTIVIEIFSFWVWLPGNKLKHNSSHFTIYLLRKYNDILQNVITILKWQEWVNGKWRVLQSVTNQTWAHSTGKLADELRRLQHKHQTITWYMVSSVHLIPM